MRAWHISYIVILGSMLVGACSSSKKSGKPPATTKQKNEQTADSVYDSLLGIWVPANANPILLKQVEQWVGTAYQFGGQSHAGTDCSGLICSIYPVVFQHKPPRTTAEMKKTAVPIAMEQLQEGDLVFFNINTKETGHAGIYLWNGYFVHATTRRGVIVSNLSEDYWKKYFSGGGRLAPANP